MTHLLGDFELPNIAGTPVIVRRANTYFFYGFFPTIAALEQLQEMLRKSPSGAWTIVRLGESEEASDNTEDSVLTKYCYFDIEELRDGFYLLSALETRFEKYESYYPFKLTLLFLGTDGRCLDGFTLFSFDEESNDWGI